MKLRLVWVGKTKSAPLKSLLDDYLERLMRFTRAEVVELRDRSGEGDAALACEGEDICKRLEGDPFVILLDERGRGFTSAELAALLELKMTTALKQITFVVGSHDGVASSVRARADMILSLSPLTLTHEMARLVLVEQVYRAHTMIRGLKYQR